MSRQSRKHPTDTDAAIPDSSQVAVRGTRKKRRDLLRSRRAVTSAPLGRAPDTNEAILPVITRIVNRFPARMRLVARLRWGLEGRIGTYDEIGRELGVTIERVRQIEMRALGMSLMSADWASAIRRDVVVACAADSLDRPWAKGLTPGSLWALVVACGVFRGMPGKPPATWVPVPKVPTLPKANENRILAAIPEGGITLRDMSVRTGVGRGSCQRILQRLLRQGRVVKEGPTYLPGPAAEGGRP